MAEKPRFLFYLSYAMCAVFLLSAAVQYNDPDPLLWMGVYGAAALLTWLQIRDRLNWLVPALAGLLLLGWAFILLPRVWGVVVIPDLFEAWEMKNRSIEIAREAGGLLIIAAWLLYLVWADYTYRPVPEQEES